MKCRKCGYINDFVDKCPFCAPRHYPDPEMAMDLIQDSIHIDLPGRKVVHANKLARSSKP